MARADHNNPPPAQPDYAGGAAYRFVPLSAAVHFPDWADEVSHDVPFDDGIVGSFEVRLQACTPPLIADDSGTKQTGNTAKTKTKINRSFVRIGGQLAVPGSTIRGMVRNVVEIASFGKFGSWVDDRRLSLRDLNKNSRRHYGDYMSEHVQGGYRARSKAGWLELAPDGGWQIQPCAHARVRIDELIDIFKRTRPGKSADLFDGRPRALIKYISWGFTPADLQIRCDVSDDKPQPTDGGLVFRKAANFGTGKIKGTLVFTGQPNQYDHPNGKSKKREFIFFDEGVPPPPIPVSRLQQREFEHIHSQSERHDEPILQADRELLRQWLQAGHTVRNESEFSDKWRAFLENRKEPFRPVPNDWAFF